MTARVPLHGLAGLALTALALTGCATTSRPPSTSASWTMQTSATAGAALVLGDQGRDVLRLACRRNPPDLYLASDRLKPAHGPVELRVGEAAFTLRPAPGEPRLAATAPMPDALPAALLDGGRLRVSADGQQLDDLPTPDGKMVAAFVISCRAEPARG